jgi:hypothetical protein
MIEIWKKKVYCEYRNENQDGSMKLSGLSTCPYYDLAFWPS